MSPLVPLKSPLSQVVFVHDYVQLVFQDEGFSLYNPIVVKRNAIEYEQGAGGFADTLVALIGVAALKVSSSDESILVIDFENGAQVRLKRSEGTGPEAFQFTGPCGLIVVGSNA